MLGILFGWRKASKCKRLIRRVQCRLKLLKNKRYSIVRQLREDVAQLIRTGYEEVAIDRAQQLFRDESIMTVYELLDHFCEFIIIHLSYIRRHKDCPNDINEAISSLVFSSARCGELPELRAIRELFGERYGDGFIKGALELHPGSLVNPEIRDKLSIASVPEDVKLRLVEEISRDYCLQPEILALEYVPQLQKQMKEIMEPRVVDATTEHRVQVLENKSVDSKSVLVRATRASSSSSSSPANSPQFYREKVVYLDDVEEVQSPLRPNINYQDRRMFKFKHSPSLPKQMPDQEGHSEESDSWEDHKSPVRKSQIGLGKRARRRSTFGDNRCTKSRPKVQSDDASSRSRMKPCCKVKECSLENPCYDHVSNEKNDVEDIVKKLLMKRAALVQPEKDDRTCSDNVAAVYDVFTYTAYEPRKSPETDDDSSSNNSSDDNDDDDDLLTYLRTMTMPPERPKLVQSEKVLRSNSCPSQHPNHVHPKLPDYDEIAAKFWALRQEYLLQKKDLSGT